MTQYDHLRTTGRLVYPTARRPWIPFWENRVAQPGQKPDQTGDAYHFIYWETNSGCLRRLIKPYLSMTSSICSDRIISINKQIGTFTHVHCFVNPALHLQIAGVTVSWGSGRMRTSLDNHDVNTVPVRQHRCVVIIKRRQNRSPSYN